jgi:hypothetical protein
MPLLLALILLWLPGAVIFRAPVLDRDTRAALPPEERTFWAVVISVAVTLSVALALAAASRYRLERVVAVDLLIAAAVAAAARLRLRLPPGAGRLRLTVLVPIALIAIGVWRFFPPSEYVIGGKDPGVYVNEGIQIAQRGTLFYRDPVVAAVPPFARDLFFPDYHSRSYFSLRFMGFFVQDPDTGATIGQFPHLFPASVAIAYGIDGLTGARRTVGAWALRGLVAVYLLGARVFRRAAAAAAAVLLAQNVNEVWFGRYPNTELAMQALAFAALLANARTHVEDDPFFAPVGGWLTALLLFIRFDAVLIVAAIAVGQLLGLAAGQRLRWRFWAPVVVALPLWAWYLLGPMRAYAELPIVFVSNLRWWQYAAVAAAAIAAPAAAVAALRRPRVGREIVRWLPPLLNGAVFLLAVYALFLRHPGGRLAPHDAYALRTFTAFYFTLPALIAAIIGYFIVARGLFWRDAAFMVTLTGFSLFFFYKIRIVPDHFWMARRFGPVSLPGALLLASAAALSGVRGQRLAIRAIRLPIGVVFLGLVAMGYARAARPIMNHVEYAGIIPRLERLASLIQEDDLVIVESRNASDLHVLALPLADIYNRKVLVLTNPVPDKGIFGAFLDRMAPRFRRILFLGSGGTDLVSPRWSASAIASDRFVVPEYESARDAYPRFDRGLKVDYTLYVFGPPQPPQPTFDLDIGANDDVYLVRFYAKERTDGRMFRWTRARSFLTLPGLSPTNRTITFWMSDGGRPASAPPASVTVSIDDKVLGSVVVAGGFAPYTFPLPTNPPGTDGPPVRLTIVTTTWNPNTVLGTGDDRELGVMVDRVAVK